MKQSGYLSPEHAVALDLKTFNAAMAKSRKWGITMHFYDGTNTSNVWHVTFSKLHFYMVSSPRRQVQYPAKVNNAWCQEIYRSEAGILRRTHSAIEAGLLDDSEVIEGVSERSDDILDDSNVVSGNEQQNLLYEAIRISAAPTIERPSGIYWDSTDAKKLFGARPDDENVLTTLERKIDILKASNQTAEGYRCVIFGRDPHNICTQHQIYQIRQHCAILCMAYIFAKDQMHDHKTTWEICCSQACSLLNMCGIQQITDWSVLERCNIAFQSRECFDHPNPHVALGKTPEPLLFQAFPSIKEDIQGFCLHDLANLTVEKVQDYILSHAIPKCMQDVGVLETEKRPF